MAKRAEREVERKTNYAALFGLYLVVLSVSLACFVSVLWSRNTAVDVWETDAPFLGEENVISPDERFILLVLLAGAIGSSLHAATSFATYVGNRSFVQSWYLWYAMRPFVGALLALVVYFVVRGGFLPLVTDGGDVDANPFGIAALSGLVGMFSKQATDKLREVFDNLFRTAEGRGDDERANKISEMRSVRELMLDTQRITACRLGEDEAESDVSIEALYNMLDKTVTRIPVFDSIGAVKYVVHESLLYRFIAEKNFERVQDGGDVSESTLQDLLDHNELGRVITQSIGFVSADSTLDHAKIAMDSKADCRDIFVTSNGAKHEPVLGWLTNVELGRHLRV